LKAAQEVQKKQKDNFLAVDHIIQVLPDDRDFGNAMNEVGLSKKTFKETIKTI